MAIDHAGTKPGLIREEQQENEVLLRCKKCPSMRAVEVTMAGRTPAGVRMYRCCECKHAWGVQVGGSIDL